MAQIQSGQQWDIGAAVRFGCKASARIIESLGTLDHIAWADEVDIPKYPPQAEPAIESVSVEGT